VITALRAIVDAEARSASGAGPDPDERSPAQRRADALGEMCRQWLDRQDRPVVGGERPHVTVTVSGETLAGVGPGRTGGVGVDQTDGRDHGDTLNDQGGPAVLDLVGPISVAMARRLACDAGVMRVVLAEPSEPLDVGRRAKVVPPGMRRAVIVRDRRCRFPGCDRPPPWCDAHHVVHWADGGPTALTNLVLLCRQHHRSIHAGRASVEMVDGDPVFRRSDGTVLVDPREHHTATLATPASRPAARRALEPAGAGVG
jgi:hypothetical protein